MTIDSLKGFGYSFIRFLYHFLRKEDIYSLQSPFAYRIVRGLLDYQKLTKNKYLEIESIRKEFLGNNSSVPVRDFGAGSKFFKGKYRKIGDIARVSCSPRKSALYYQYFCSLTPRDVVLELGTCLGITTSYLLKICKGKIFTFEGEEALLQLANEHLGREDKVELVAGNINQTLPEILGKVSKVDFVLMDANHSYEATRNYFSWIKPLLHEESILVLGDIYWSKGMNKAWKEIINDTDVKLSMDFYYFGMVFFGENYTKANYYL